MGDILIGKGSPHIQIKNMEVTVNYFTVHFSASHETILHYTTKYYLNTPPGPCGYLFTSDFREHV